MTMVPSAYLRVYQPLDAFERSEQLHWERFLLHGPQVTSLRPRYADRRTVGSLGVLAPADPDTAEVLHVEGRTLISPRRMRMRVLAAMVSFRESQPVELWDQFVPRKDGRRARRDLARLRRPPGTCPSAGSCSSATTNASSSRTSGAGGACATAPRPGVRSGGPSRRSHLCGAATSVPSVT
jgi:hypothetical protein